MWIKLRKLKHAFILEKFWDNNYNIGVRERVYRLEDYRVVVGGAVYCIAIFYANTQFLVGGNNMFLSFLSTYMNWIINGVGGIVSILLIGNYISLRANRSQIEEATNRKVTNTFLNRNTMETHDEEAAGAVTPDTIRLYEKKFNGVCSFFYAVSQYQANNSPAPKSIAT